MKCSQEGDVIMAKSIQIQYKGHLIYEGNIISGVFDYRAPEGISQKEWNAAICDLLSRFDKFLVENGRDPAPPSPSEKVAYAHAEW